jgi:cysteine desulfurase family protein
MAYLNNAATTFPKNSEVLDKALEFYKNFGTNAGRTGETDKSLSGNIIEKTRDVVRELFHINKTYDVIFQPSATLALNVVLQGLDYENISTVYISPFEHNTVTRVLHALQERYSFTVEQLAVDKKAMVYDLERINQQFLINKPSAVIVSHASNVFGIIAPIKDIFKAAKMYGAITIADMAQTAGLIDTNLNESNVDCAVFAGHKTLYSMIGVGGLVMRNSIKLKPIVFGGTGIDSASITMPSDAPARYEAGSHNILAIASLYYSIQWLLSAGLNKVAEQEKSYYNKMLTTLRKYKNIKLIGVSADTVGVVSCLFDKLAPEEVAKIFTQHGVEIRPGLHCSPYAHKFMGTFPAGTVRLSVGYFTTDKDLQELDNVLKYIEEDT